MRDFFFADPGPFLPLGLAALTTIPAQALFRFSRGLYTALTVRGRRYDAKVLQRAQTLAVSCLFSASLLDAGQTESDNSHHASVSALRGRGALPASAIPGAGVHPRL
jgi:hypothetical protein